MSNPRRKFIVNAAKVGVASAVAGVAVSACSNNKPQQKELSYGKTKKQEVLYQKSKYWDAYYKVAY